MFVSWRLHIKSMRNLHFLFCTPSPQTGDAYIDIMKKELVRYMTASSENRKSKEEM